METVSLSLPPSASLSCATGVCRRPGTGGNFSSRVSRCRRLVFDAVRTLIAWALLCGGLLFFPTPARAGEPDVTAAQVNGTWKCSSGVFKIWALGGGKLQVDFSGVYDYKLADGSPMANAGAGSGTASIAGQTAKFKPDDTEPSDMITLRFVHGHLEVEQEGACGFGKHVTAAGTYRRVSARKPVFEGDSRPGQ